MTRESENRERTARSSLCSRCLISRPRFSLSAHQPFGRAAVDRDIGAMDKATTVGSEKQH